MSKEIHMYVCMYMYIGIHTCVCIYIYSEGERERERERESTVETVCLEFVVRRSGREAKDGRVVPVS